MDRNKYLGILVAFYACYDPQNHICPEKTMRLAQWYVEKGVQGLYLTGSSGEGMMQSVEERKLVVESVMKAVGGKTTVIVHVGAANTSDAVKLSTHAANVGADGISSVPQIYYPLPEPCIEAYWDALIDAAKLPFFIYNIPAVTGYNLSFNLFEKMIRKDYVAGIKTTSESGAMINAFRRIGGKSAVIYNGVDAQLLGGLSMGADGGIGGTYGCMPELYVKIYQAFRKGDIALAQLWQNRANIAYEQSKQPYTNGIATMKAVLAARGMDTGGVRLPFLPVDPKLPAIVKTAEMIEGWLAE